MKTNNRLNTFTKLSLVALVVQSAWALKFEIPKELEAEAEAQKVAEEAALKEEIDAIQSAGAPIKPAAEELAPEGMSFSVVDEVTASIEADPATEELAPLHVESDDLAADEGRVYGQIVDKDTGVPVAGVAILLESGVEGEEVGTVTDADGQYIVGPAKAGLYALTMLKDGYIQSTVTDYEVEGGLDKQFAFALPPRPAEMSDEAYELTGFTVSEEEANDMMMKLDIRMQSDTMMDLLSAEDFSKFAASDVAEAIKRLPGVTVQEGKFAVIRGLDERYSSTLFNGAPVPSPDPDRQSVPLDLFPSEVVRNLSISKTYSPEYQGNAAAGTINIMTNSYAEEFEVNFKGGLSVNENAEDIYLDGGRKRRSIDYGNLGSAENLNTAIAAADDSRLTPRKKSAPQEYEFSIDFSSTEEIFDRQFRYLASFSHEEDYETIEGTRHDQFANPGFVFPIPGNPIVIRSGDLAEGKLGYSKGDFDTIESVASEVDTYLLSFLSDIDKEGLHKVGYTYFKVSSEETTSSIQQNGSFESVSQDDLRNQGGFYEGYVDLFNGNGGYDALLASGLYRSLIIDQERELETNQIMGEHDLVDLLDGLSFSWIYSLAETEQTETNAFVANAIELPDGSYNTGQNTDMGPALAPSAAWRQIEEEQDYYGAEVSYTHELTDTMELESTVGFSSEETEREVAQEIYIFSSGFKELTSVNLTSTTSDDLNELIADAAGFPNIGAVRPDAKSDGLREIDAYFFNTKLSVGDKFDFIAGVRYEEVLMTTETSSDGDFFNFELLRDTSEGGATPQRAIENTQILGLDGPLDPNFIGVIDEEHWLPALTFIYRPIEPVRVVAAYSQTVARPSFKEFTYITTQDPSSLDYVSGNPTLETSDVESFDLRVEYVTDSGDLYAIGAFWKIVDQPIEKTSLFGAVQTDIYFNNPNDVDIYGLEIEARKSLDFFENDFLSYFSVGGNLALIEAEIDVPQSFQDLFSGGFILENGQRVGGNFYAEAGSNEFLAPEDSRPLFNQAEWIANFDITFEQPEWGTRATLALFAQSDVLDSAAGYLGGEGNTVASVDRYQESYYQLDFTLKQRLTDNWTLGFSAKNLTDTERKLVYDDDVVSAADNRTYKLGREYSISLSASF